MSISKVAVIGSGSWGTAVSGLLGLHADQVMIWSHDQEIADYINEHHRNPVQLNTYTMLDCVSASTDYQSVLKDAQAIVMVVPSQFIRACAQAAQPYVDSQTPVLILTKGIENHTNYTMSEVLSEVWGNPARIAVLSGPNHAEEICKGKISAAVIAATHASVAQFFQRLIMNENFRIYLSDDVVGVELCAAIKNVVAIACGICTGLGYGDNALAVLMTRGLAEISRIVIAKGGKSLTCMGLAGMGDLIATCTSVHSRNRSFGCAFSQGESLQEYEQRTSMVVEGARAALSTQELCKKLSIESPLTNSVYSVLYEHAKLEDVIALLLERIPHEEFYGMSTNN